MAEAEALALAEGRPPPARRKAVAVTADGDEEETAEEIADQPKRTGEIVHVSDLKRRTASEFMDSYHKAVTGMSHLLDDDVSRYLNFEQMNHLLASSTTLLDDLAEFVRTVRKELISQDYGFMETYVFCGLCGRRELVGSGTCNVCGSVLKRCIECGHYDRAYQQCSFYGYYIYGSEAEMPTEDSHSFRCEQYTPKVDVKRAAAPAAGAMPPPDFGY